MHVGWCFVLHPVVRPLWYRANETGTNLSLSILKILFNVFGSWFLELFWIKFIPQSNTGINNQESYFQLQNFNDYKLTTHFIFQKSLNFRFSLNNFCKHIKFSCLSIHAINKNQPTHIKPNIIIDVWVQWGI